MLKQDLVLLFLLRRGELHCVLGCLTPLELDLGAEAESLRPATRVRALVATIQKLGLLQMVTTQLQLIASELGLTNSAFKSDQARPDFPVDVLPLDLLLVVHKLDEAIQVKEPVWHVLSYHLTVEVNEDLGVRAHHPLVLLTCIEPPAVNAPAQQSLVLTPIR